MARIAAIQVVDGDFALTQGTVAILCNCSIPTLNKWHKEANPPPRNSDGSYSAKAIGKWLAEEKPRKRGPGRPPENPADPSMADAEKRLKVAQALKLERENAVAEGLLMPIDKIERIWQDILMRVRSRMLKIPSTLAPIVLGDADPFSIETKLKDAVYDALSEASDDWRDGVESDDTN